MDNLKLVYRGVGYAQYTSLSSAIALTSAPASGGALPTDNDKRPLRAVIRCETQAVRWRDDGTAPTATVGMPLAVGDTLIYDGPLNQIQFIEQTASAKLNVIFQQ